MLAALFLYIEILPAGIILHFFRCGMSMRALHLYKEIKMNHYSTLEFDKILEKLAQNALSESAQKRCLALEPSLNEAEVKRRMDETTQARRIIEQIGTPPLSSMPELKKDTGPDRYRSIYYA